MRSDRDLLQGTCLTMNTPIVPIPPCKHRQLLTGPHILPQSHQRTLPQSFCCWQVVPSGGATSLQPPASLEDGAVTSPHREHVALQ